MNINEWNRLPGDCDNATNVDILKNNIDTYFNTSVCVDVGHNSMNNGTLDATLSYAILYFQNNRH